MTTLYLVRHAQARPLPEETEPEWALSETGRTQAEALVPVLSGLGIQRVYTSPFRRSRDTLRPFAAAAGLKLVEHEGLRERCLTSGWIGDFREIWQRSWADLGYTLDGGESSLVCRTRMVAAVQEIAERHPGEIIALGSHGYSIGLFLTTLAPTFGIEEASAMRTPDIFKVVLEGPALRWDRGFHAGARFDAIATHFRQTPGIVA